MLHGRSCAPSYGPGSSIWIVCVLWYVNRARIRPTTYLLHIVTRTSNVYESDCMQSPDEERGRQGSAILVGVVGSMPGLGQMPSAVVRGPWRVRCQGVGLSFSMSPSIGQLSDLGCMTLPRSATGASDEANWLGALRSHESPECRRHLCGERARPTRPRQGSVCGTGPISGFLRLVCTKCTNYSYN